MKMNLLLCFALIMAGASCGSACRGAGKPLGGLILGHRPKPRAMDNDIGICAAVIQDLTFKNNIGCIDCATNFCLQDKTIGLQQAVKNEGQCNAILACLKVHGKECGCIA